MKRYDNVGLLDHHKQAILRSVGITCGEGRRRSCSRNWKFRSANGEWEVEAIIAKRMSEPAGIVGGKEPGSVARTTTEPFYQIKWAGYDETSWEPLSNLQGI